MVVTLGYTKRLEVGLDIAADGFGVHEVHGCACHRNGFAERDEALGGWQELGGVEAKHMVQHRAGTFAVEVEIGVVGQVHHRSLVGLRGEGELQAVVVAPLVTRHYLEIAGVARFAVGTEVHEFHGIAVLTALPVLVLEPFGPSV